MAPSPSIDRPTFLAYLRQSALLEADDLTVLEQRFPDVHRGRTLARRLVEEGILTRFQAERLLVGRTGGFVLGQYRILEPIGRGGMGRVFRAEHRTMRRVVALKVLATRMLQTERAVELFLHEVRAIAALQHPNIVHAYDANEINGRYFLVLEYVDGPNLDELVRRQGPLPVGLACEYLRQVASGLACAHQQGMLHRDLKPANLLVQRGGVVKISDFGLARLATPLGGTNATAATILTRENSVMGTPDYLSPEQSRNLHRTDIRSDLYSLGATFHFLLTGQVPFPGGTALDKFIRHASETPRPVTSFRSDVSPEVAAIVHRLLAKHPDDRFQTAGELADALLPHAVGAPLPWAAPVRLGPAPATCKEALITPAGELQEEAVSFTWDASDSDLAGLATEETTPLPAPPAPVPVPLVTFPASRGMQRPGGFQVAVAVVVALLGGMAGLGLMLLGR